MHRTGIKCRRDSNIRKEFEEEIKSKSVENKEKKEDNGDDGDNEDDENDDDEEEESDDEDVIDESFDNAGDEGKISEED